MPRIYTLQKLMSLETVLKHSKFVKDFLHYFDYYVIATNNNKVYFKLTFDYCICFNICFLQN